MSTTKKATDEYTVPGLLDENDPPFSLSYPVSIQLRQDVFVGGVQAKNLDLRSNDRNWRIIIDWDRCLCWLRVDRGSSIAVGATPLTNVLSFQYGTRQKIESVAYQAKQAAEARGAA